MFIGTSRERRPDEMNGSALYHFVSEGAMKAEINAHHYIEFGKHKQHLYGIKVDSVLEVIESGRMCVLDVKPQVSTTKHCLISILVMYLKPLKYEHYVGQCTFSRLIIT